MFAKYTDKNGLPQQYIDESADMYVNSDEKRRHHSFSKCGPLCLSTHYIWHGLSRSSGNVAAYLVNSV